MISIQLTGFKELAAQLRAIPNEMAEKDLISAASVGTSVVRKEVIRNARSTFTPRTGTLNRAIYQKRIKSLSDGKWKQTYIIGVLQGKRYRRIGKKQISKDAYYWWWLEFGTSKMRPHPFVRPALPAKHAEAIAAIRKRLARRIEMRRR